MNIGDKIKFDCYLPYSSSGKLLHKIKDNTKPWGWDSTILPFRNDSETNHIYGWEIKKIQTVLRTGVFLGFTNRKLKRIYNRPITNRILDNSVFGNIAHGTSVTRSVFDIPMTPVETVPIANANTILRHGNSRYRIDNKYKLDKLAIIGTSKFKRYYVDYKDIIRVNLNDTLEIL